MLKEEKALPGPEGHLSIDNRDHFAGAGEDHTDMGRHVIGALGGVDEIGGILRDKVVEEVLEVRARTWIRIFHDHQTGAGVLDEDGHRACFDPGLGNDGRDLSGNLVGSFPRSADREAGRMICHDSRRIYSPLLGTAE